MPGPGVEEAVRPAADETAAEQQAEAGPSTSAPSPGLVPCFLMTHSVSKRHNVGMLARSASAFGVKEVQRCTWCPKALAAGRAPCERLFGG